LFSFVFFFTFGFVTLHSCSMESTQSNDDSSASSLATVCFGFFVTEFGVSLKADDTLSSRGLKDNALEALEAYLLEMIGFTFAVPLSNATVEATFASIVDRCNQAMRKKNVDVEATVSQLLEPDPTAEKSSTSTPSSRLAGAESSSTPNARRKNAVEKGISRFAGMTLRNRNPSAQQNRQKAAVQRPVARANVLVTKQAAVVAVPSKGEWDNLKVDDEPK
jgi:hypothetical protein